MTDPDADFVTIRSYPMEAHAQVARAHLEGEGIPALVLPGEIVLHHGLGEYQLIVPRFLEEQALAVLYRTDDEDGSEGPNAPEICLACRQPMSEAENRCRHCGWSFDDGAEIDDEELAN